MDNALSVALEILRKRQKPSVAKFLDLTKTTTAEEFGRQQAVAEMALEPASSFRPGSKNTQIAQDHHLEVYRKYARSKHDTDPAAQLSEEYLDKWCFPDPLETPSEHHDPFGLLYERLGSCIFSVAHNIQSRGPSQSVRYKSMLKYCRSFVFWADQKYSQRNLIGPSKERLFQVMRKHLLYACKNFDIKVNFSIYRQEKIGLIGTWELMLLLDHDLQETPCIELAECHQLAWTLGRLAALRPGALGQTANTEDIPGSRPYLTWADIYIEREDEPGHFYTRISIRNLKTNRQETQRILTL